MLRCAQPLCSSELLWNELRLVLMKFMLTSSESNSTEAKTGYTWRPVSKFGEDYRIGDKAKVQDAVNDSDVQIPKPQNGLSRCHHERP